MKAIQHQRLRLMYRKDDVLKYIGQQDLLRFAFRMLRQAQIPYATSGAFSPKPRVSFGPALPLGVSASREPLDIVLAEGVQWDEDNMHCAVQALAQHALPRDFVVSLTDLAPGSLTLSKHVAGARYQLEFSEITSVQREQISTLLQMPLIIEHHGKERDLGAMIMSSDWQEHKLNLDAKAGDPQNLSIVALVKLLTSITRIACVSMHRACLLTCTGEQI